MFEIEVVFALPDVNNDPIDNSCIPIELEVEWCDKGELEYIKVRSLFIPISSRNWLSSFYESLYQTNLIFKAQIDAAIQKDIQWVKENNFIEPEPIS